MFRTVFPAVLALFLISPASGLIAAEPKVEKTYRLDKTLKTEIITTGEGTTTREYRKDGKTLESELIERADSSGSLSYFEDDGKTVYEKLVWDKYNKKKRHHYTKGVLNYTTYTLSGKSGLEVKKVYRADGSLSHEQIWYPTWNFGFDEILGGSKLGVVVEYHPANGKAGKAVDRMKRRIILRQDDSGNAETVYEYNTNGKFIAARYYRKDGTLEREQFFDGPGYDKGTKSYSSKDNKKEPAFDSLLKDPAYNN